MNPTNDTLLTPQDVAETIPELNKEFEAAHGTKLFRELYVDKINEGTLTRLSYNRDATIHLIAYFMMAALDKPQQQKDRLLESFKHFASQPGNGNPLRDKHFNEDIYNHIIKAIDRGIEDHFSGNDGHDKSGEHYKCHVA